MAITSEVLRHSRNRRVHYVNRDFHFQSGAQSFPPQRRLQRLCGSFDDGRLGGIKDPFGHTWWISTHKEDLSSEEIEQRAAASH
jgi:hypothetical protein